MPNHVHGIIIIDNHGGRGSGRGIGRDVACNGSTDTPTAITMTDDVKNQFMANISPKSGSVSTIIRSYKSAVTKHARIIHKGFTWQSRFHDHIIRNREEFLIIEHYIKNNPANWRKDRFYGELL